MTQKKYLFRLVLIVFSMFALSCSDSDEGQSEDQIVVGLLAPFSGDLAGIGQGMKNAAEMAIKEINTAGGVNGKKLVLKPVDDKTNTDVAKTAADQLIKTDKIAALIGPATSGNCKEVIPIADQNKIAMISPSATAPELNTIGSAGTFWRTIASDAMQGKVAANYAIDKLNMSGKKAGILYVDNTYGKGLAEQFKTQFIAKGGLVDDENYVGYTVAEGELDQYTFEDEATKLFKNQPDLVYLVTYMEDGAKFTLKAKEKLVGGYKPVIMGCDGNKNENFLVKADPSLILGMIGTAPAAPKDYDNYNSFLDNYKNKYNIKPEIFADNTYDAMYLFAFAMAKAKSIEHDKLAQYLMDLSGPPGDKINVNQFKEGVAAINAKGDIDYEGASGLINWNQSGDVESGYYEIWEVIQGAKGLEHSIKETIEFSE